MNVDADDPLEALCRRYPAAATSVGRGWHGLLARLDETLAAIDPGYQVDDIKEKYGTLRFYWTASRKLTADEGTAAVQAVRDAEDESARTCEFCSAPGELDESFPTWFKTRCAECAAIKAEAAAASPGYRMQPWPPMQGLYTAGWARRIRELGGQMFTVDPGVVVLRIWAGRSGELRVAFWASVSGFHPQLQVLIDAAAAELATVCRRCGEPGELRWREDVGDLRWPIAVLCEECLAYNTATAMYNGPEGRPLDIERFRHIAPGSLMFTEGEDGHLAPARYPDRVLVQARLNPETGVISWGRFDADTAPDGTEIGRAVPGAIIRRDDGRHG